MDHLNNAVTFWRRGVCSDNNGQGHVWDILAPRVGGAHPRWSQLLEIWKSNTEMTTFFACWEGSVNSTDFGRGPGRDPHASDAIPGCHVPTMPHPCGQKSHSRDRGLNERHLHSGQLASSRFHQKVHSAERRFVCGTQTSCNFLDQHCLRSFSRHKRLRSGLRTETSFFLC